MSNLTSSIIGSEPTKTMINHIIFLIDASGSMRPHLPAVKKVFDETLKNFRAIQTPDQEVRISLYQFDHEIKQVILNKSLSNIKEEISFYARGMTRMRDTIELAIKEHKPFSKKGEDHTYIVYTITDGSDNDSRITPSALKTTIAGLDDSWTIAALVPSVSDAHSAKMSGIPAGNIQVWDTTSNKGFEEVGRAITQSYTNYSTQRSTGVRSSSNIFQVNTDALARGDVRNNLTEVKGRLYHARKDYTIKPMVEELADRDYVKGCAYYELTKREKVQGYKEIVIVSKKDDKKFGGSAARQMLGLPDQETKVEPGDFGDWRIFIQSTSVNRKVLSGTSIFVTE